VIKKILFVVVLLALGVLAGYVSFRAFVTVREVEAPQLKGKRPEDAMLALGDLGLKYEVEGETYDPYVPQGAITDQTPAAGAFIRQGEAVRVIISKGPKGHLMPSVLGRSLTEAQKVLSGQGLGITKVIRVRSRTVQVNAVIAQSPQPEDETGTPVTVVVSSGDYDVSYYCPDFRGMGPESAKSLAAKLGLKTVFEGHGAAVASQRPEPGSKTRKGQSIYMRLDGGESNG
jgi:serine/threonine-protein kinase